MAKNPFYSMNMQPNVPYPYGFPYYYPSMHYPFMHPSYYYNQPDMYTGQSNSSNYVMSNGMMAPPFYPPLPSPSAP
jgi:hypothetical protein